MKPSKQPSAIQHGLLTEGQTREVYHEDMDHPVTARTYTLPEAAKALGRTELTFKKWLAEDMIPEPLLRDTIRNYRMYSEGELQAIANVLVEHEREFSYYTSKHEVTRHRIFQAVQAHRAHNV